MTIDTTATKHCSGCDTTKAVDQFYKNDKHSDGRTSKCKRCILDRAADVARQKKAGTFTRRKANPKARAEKRAVTIATYNERIRSDLDDPYVRRKLVLQTGIEYEAIPAVAVEAKRLQLQVLREAREQIRLQELHTHRIALGEVLTGLKAGLVSPDEAIEFSNKTSDEINAFLRQLGPAPQQAELEIE